MIKKVIKSDDYIFNQFYIPFPQVVAVSILNGIGYSFLIFSLSNLDSMNPIKFVIISATCEIVFSYLLSIFILKRKLHTL